MYVLLDVCEEVEFVDSPEIILLELCHVEVSLQESGFHIACETEDLQRRNKRR